MVKEVWSFIELEKGKLHETATKMASEALREAKLIGGKPCCILFGSTDKLIKELQPYGVEKFYFFQTDKEITPEIKCENICSLARKYSPQFILFAHTPLGVELGARVAAKLKKGFISNCVDFEFEGEKIVARKPIYNNKAHRYLTWATDPPYIATIYLDSLEALEVDEKISPEIVYEELKIKPGKTRFVKRWVVPPSEIDITEAPIVIGVGAGVDKKDFMGTIKKMAELIGGVIGGSRPAVFNELITQDKQIGASGKFINANIYIPIGISGSTRHTVAIKNVKHVLPINIAKEAAIFKFAEFGVVGDLYEVIPKFVGLLRKHRG